nr:DNA gyrase subunit A [Campylobacter sp.]
RAINLDDNDELVTALIASNTAQNQMLFITTKKGMCIKFKITDAREIGRVSRGVTGIRFKNANDEVIGAVVIDSDTQEILSVSQKGIGKRTTADEYRLQSRGGKGVICMKLTEKTSDLVGVVMVDEDADLMALTTSGKMIRVDMQTIRKAGRNTSGVIVVNVDGDDVVSIAKCPKEEDKFDSESDSNEPSDENSQSME